MSGPGTAVAPTLLITQKAESSLSRRAPLGSATFFGCECLAWDIRGEERFCARREERAEIVGGACRWLSFGEGVRARLIGVYSSEWLGV